MDVILSADLLGVQFTLAFHYPLPLPIWSKLVAHKEPQLKSHTHSTVRAKAGHVIAPTHDPDNLNRCTEIERPWTGLDTLIKKRPIYPPGAEKFNRQEAPIQNGSQNKNGVAIVSG